MFTLLIPAALNGRRLRSLSGVTPDGRPGDGMMTVLGAVVPDTVVPGDAGRRVSCAAFARALMAISNRWLLTYNSVRSMPMYASRSFKAERRDITSETYP